MIRPSTVTVLLAVALHAAACSGGKISAAPGGTRAAAYSPGDRMRVMLAQPGPGGDVASQEVSKRVVAVLQQMHGDVALIPTTNRQEALAAAREAKAAYLVSPVIEEWSDGHAPPFTADRVRVRLDLEDPASGGVVSSVTFSSISPFFAVTDSGPEVLLDQTFDRAVTKLVQSG